MKLRNLTKKIIGDGVLRLSEDGEHITNGHWLCRRELLKQAPQLTSVESARAFYPKADVKMLRNPEVSAVIPKMFDPITVTRTEWIKTMSGENDAVLFVGGKDDALQLWISRVYVDLFEIEELVIESDRTHRDWSPGLMMKGDEWQVCVMPMRIPDQPGLR